ncbi:alpha/beta fold hydrolase [Methanosarcina horonobensis]|uniref:alpha/beta fold hydrolase n=1 Tax=Methanosarcina horonobensis TaxID=418008 RepID=UPI000AC81837|nr:alpha/beta hydrolase [Methanosarcina horonobensis]
MENLRKYGSPPFTVAVIHGGPGAPGEMAPVAKELSAITGVLEPLQTKATLEDQVEELRDILKEHADLPVTLIGFSWGAMLSFIFISLHPQFVKKLILIGSGPYEGKYATKIMSTRISRLGKEDLENFLSLNEALDNLSAKNRNEAFCKIGMLISKADTYDPLPHEEEPIECSYEIFKGVWEEASDLRSSGELLKLGTKITCPVVAIHGDYDPHPFKGVEEPLSGVLEDFRFILLEKCGHKPG